ncbi:MAG: uridine kinase [Bacteroidetes bacterium]|nr:uridine kinase [Bacteroidota bacterium]
MEPYIVGITGGSASGKTSFLNALNADFSKEEVCLISFDNYYKPLAQIPLDPNGQPNFDEPEALDIEAVVNDLEKLKNGQSYERAEYNFNLENWVPKILKHHSAKIIIVEGLFIFSEPEILKHLNLRIYIDAKDDLRWHRRVSRDRTERNVDAVTSKYQWQNHVEPSESKYLIPYKEIADIIILNNTSFDVGLQILKNHFKQQIQSNP